MQLLYRRLLSFIIVIALCFSIIPSLGERTVAKLHIERFHAKDDDAVCQETSEENSDIVAESHLLQAAATESAWKWDDE